MKFGQIISVSKGKSWTNEVILHLLSTAVCVCLMVEYENMAAM